MAETPSLTQISAVSVGTALGGPPITVIIVQGIMHRHGIDLSPDEAVAYGTAILPFWHFFGSALTLVATGTLNRLQKWVNKISPPSSSQPAGSPS